MNKKVIKMEDSKKNRRKTKMKKKEKNGETEERKTLGKNINNDIFFKNQMVSKKRGDTELECKTGVKHNSQQYIFEN